MKKQRLYLRTTCLMAICLLVGGISTGCGMGKPSLAGQFKASSMINVYSREDGSGTRGAFIELFGIEWKDENGEKWDLTTVEATITNSTEVMLQSIAGDVHGIGYVSLGSLNSTVKAVKIDGVEVTVDNIKAGTYSGTRPFHIVTAGEGSEAVQAFVRYILSAQGQAVIEKTGYIAAGDAGIFSTDDVTENQTGDVTENQTGNVTENQTDNVTENQNGNVTENLSGTAVETSNRNTAENSSGAVGKIVVGGSSSVAPMMEKLIEAYKNVAPNIKIEIQASDSTTGVTGTAEGTLDIGMASRELKASELEAGVNGIRIALDGIAVIVNPKNPAVDLSSDVVRKIFTGELAEWDAVS